MTKFVKVCRLEELPAGERLWYDLSEETVVVFHVDDNFYAIADVCTHDDGPLADGDLTGFQIECPRHGACFDIRNGAALSMPAVSPVPIYPIKIEDGFIWLGDPTL